MKIVVTGATGFVGSHCLESLSKLNDIEVVAACRDKARLPLLHQADAREGDLLDETYLETLLDGIDVVIHAAAWTSLWGHKKKSEKYFLEPTLKLIEMAKKQGVDRFVFISTLASASPDDSADPMSHGIKRAYWPHLSNVIDIEETLRSEAGNSFTVVNLRLGLFAGSRFALGLLPILVPRLKTHLVPWVAAGTTTLEIIDGRDIGTCVGLAATTPGLDGYQSFNVTGPEIPTTRDVIEYLNERYQIPLPHFSVSFPIAFAFAWLMEVIDPVVPWEPLVTRSIIHLLRNTHADNKRANELLGYIPKHHWKEAIDLQMKEMSEAQVRPMSMAVPIRRGE